MFGKKKKVTYCGRSYEQLQEALLWLSYLKEDIILGDEEADAVDAGREAIAGIMGAMTDMGRVYFDEA